MGNEMDRKEFLKILGAGLAGVGGTILGTSELVNLPSGYTLKQLEKEFLQPGVSVGLETKVEMTGVGDKYMYDTPIIDISLLSDFYNSNEVNAFVEGQFDYKKFKKSHGKKSGENLLNFVECVAGNYTLVALIGSASKKILNFDKFDSDIDVLVLNGGEKPYNAPREDGLFHNQRKNISGMFRNALLKEVVEFYGVTNPKKAKDIQDHFNGSKHKKIAKGFYATYPTTDKFIFPKDMPFYSNQCLPIHVLTSKDGKAENVAHNIKLLKEEMPKGNATILYIGNQFKLI